MFGCNDFEVLMRLRMEEADERVSDYL